MALRDQKISLPLAKGINTKFDPKLVSPEASNLVVQNGRIEDAAVKKRFAYQDQPFQIPNESTSDIRATGKFKNEPLLFTDSEVYSYTAANKEVVSKGFVSSVDVERLDLFNDSQSHKTFDSARIDDVLCTIVVKDGVPNDGEVRAVFVDLIQNSVISVLDLGASATNAKVVAASERFVFFLGESTNINVRIVDLSDLSSLVGLGSVSGASDIFDVAVRSPTQILLFAYDSGSNNIEFGYINPFESPLNFNSTTLSVDSDQAIAVDYDQNTDQFFVALAGTTLGTSSGSGARIGIYDGNLDVVSATSTIAYTLNHEQTKRLTIAANPEQADPSGFFPRAQIVAEIDASVVRFTNLDVSTGAIVGMTRGVFYTGQEVTFDVISGTPPTGLTSSTNYFVRASSAGQILDLYANLNDALFDNSSLISGPGSGSFTLTNVSSVNTNYILSSNIAANGSASTAVINFTGCHLASEPFFRNNTCYYLLDFESDLQSTSFLVRNQPGQDSRVVSKCNYDVSKGEVKSLSSAPGFVQINESEWFVSNAFRTTVETENETFTYQTAANGHFFNFDVANRFFNEELNRNTIIAGGIVRAYDGRTLSELNFNQFPEEVILGQSTTGGTLAAGQYGVQVIYEWVDLQGNFHRSAPSPVQTITTTGSTSRISVSVQQTQFTDKNASEVRAVIYLTQVNGTLYYRTAELSFTDDGVLFSHDATAPITAQPNGTEELIYTTGGVVANTAPPPSRLVATSKNRCFLVNSENKQQIWYSKPTVINQGTAFNSIFTRNISQTAADVSTITTMDDKLIAYKPDEIYFWSGDGPNLLGVNDTFTETRLITNQVGCDNPDSVVFMKDGCMFQSGKKGIWTLGRGLEVAYTGAAVQGFNNLKVTAANNIRSANEVRFTTAEGSQLVYDYLSQQWITDERVDASDAIVIDEQYYYVNSQNQLLKEVSGTFLDTNRAISMVVETPWIKLQGLQGFQRVKRLMVLGQFKSSHTLKIEMAYDYEDFFREVKYWQAGQILETIEFGDDATFGDDEVFGGTQDSVYQVEVHMPRQKCQSVKFRFTDLTNQVRGESMQLTGIDLLVGVKEGLNKLGVNRKL